MRNATKTKKEQIKPVKSSGRFASPEEAAQAKNAGLMKQVKKIGLTVSGSANASA